MANKNSIMSRVTTSLYLKIFLFCGILFGVFMGLFYILNTYASTKSVIFSLGLGTILGVLAGLLFGLIMSLILGTLHIRSLKAKQYPITDETIGVSHAREIKTDVPPAEALKLCASSLVDTVEGSRIVREDREAGRVEAKTPLSWRSWGEKLACDVRGESDGGSTIRVSSRPVLNLTIADYGKNLTNVENIVRYIKGRAFPSAK